MKLISFLFFRPLSNEQSTGMLDDYCKTQRPKRIRLDSNCAILYDAFSKFIDSSLNLKNKIQLYPFIHQMMTVDNDSVVLCVFSPVYKRILREKLKIQ
jgi:hypothetical protein